MNKGFTLLEIVLVIGICVILLAVGLPMTFDLYYRASFESEYNLLTSALQQARSLAIINNNQANHGVYVGTNGYVVFQGASYAGRTVSQDRVYPRATQVTVSGATELVFTALSGSVASTSLSLTDGTRNRDLFVNSEGLIYEPSY